MKAAKLLEDFIEEKTEAISGPIGCKEPKQRNDTDHGPGIGGTFLLPRTFGTTSAMNHNPVPMPWTVESHGNGASAPIERIEPTKSHTKEDPKARNDHGPVGTERHLLPRSLGVASVMKDSPVPMPWTVESDAKEDRKATTHPCILEALKGFVAPDL